jgi:predicted GNAT family acetyltransferase
MPTGVEYGRSVTDHHGARATEAGAGQTTADAVVKDHQSEHRYEITVAGRPAGYTAYLDRPGGEGGGQRRVFIHTETDPNYEGQGLGSVLARAALADVRASGRRAVAVCPFIAAYLKRHPEEADIVDRATPAILSSL